MSAQLNASSAWFKKAEGALFGADAIYKSSSSSSPHWDLVLFLAHEAIEKYLKGCLTAQRIAIPKTRDLLALLQLCSPFLPELLPLEADLDEAGRLYISSRYPGMRDISESHANKALETARSVGSFALKRFAP